MNKDFKYKNTTGIELTYPKDMHDNTIQSENSNNNKKKGWVFEKSIDLYESLGIETQIFFKLNNKEIISRMYNPRLVKVGEKINFEIDITKIHFFDHEKEKAI